MAECIPVLITPFTKSKEIDLMGLTNLLNYYHSKKIIKRLWVLGTGAEDIELTFNEKTRILKTCVEFKDHYFDILAGCSFNSFKDTEAFIDITNKYDLSGIHYLPNNKLISLDLLEKIYKKIARISNNPLYAYTSANWGRTIPPEFINKLKKIKNIRGIKFSTSNIVHTELALSLADNSFEVIPAVIKQLLPSLTLGCKSFTTVEASIFLDEIMNIVSLFNQNNLLAAREMQRNLNNLIMESTFTPTKHNFLRTAEIKSILEYRNICKRWVASGLMQIDQHDYEKLKKFQ